MGKKNFLNQQGFTLIETAITIAVCTISLLAILNANVFMGRNNSTFYERFAAFEDAHEIIEQMRNSSLAGQFPSNLQTAYPNGTRIAQNSKLKNENIQINYTTVASDLLDVHILVSWIDLNNRQRSITLNSLLTQRE
jgi:Tfp pilus assembly protein PilV